MKKKSAFSFVHASILPRLGTLLLSALVLVSFFVVPVSATEGAGTTGWLEAHVDVPEDFHESVVMYFHSKDTGEEYTIWLMESNEYLARYELDEGEYVFDKVAMSDNDSFFIASLVYGPKDFTVSAKADAAILFEFVVTFNEELFYEGFIPAEDYSFAPETTEAPTTVPETTVPESTSTETIPDESETTQPVEPETEATEPSAPETTGDAEEVSSDEEEGLSFWQRLLYMFIATLIFALLVFVVAYLYRQHVENS